MDTEHAISTPPASRRLPDVPTIIRVSLADGTSRDVVANTMVKDLLPERLGGGGARVVAGLYENRLVSLSASLPTDGRLTPVLAGTLEGERVLRRSLGLLALEAIATLWPTVQASLGASLGFGQPILTSPPLDASCSAPLFALMSRLVHERRPFVETSWTVEEARRQLSRQGDDVALPLLDFWRHPSVPLVSCGSHYALGLGPFLPDTGGVARFSIGEHDGHLFLLYRDREETAQKPLRTMQLLAVSAPSKRATDMVDAHARWLGQMGIDGVGALNAACVRGDVRELIEIDEGFHERRVADIATEIAARGRSLRAVLVAGPSASGKTTFLRRLKTQLRVLGKDTLGLSLDDYYLDHDRCPLDEEGAPDFEAYEALDLPLLHQQLDGLLAGRAVALARYDFAGRRSEPSGGPTRTLGVDQVLLIEGLHGLHPLLFAGTLPESALFRIFVNPSTSLSFDALSRFNPSDLRLLRRIVRDRLRRAIPAADNLARWASVRRGEKRHIFPHLGQADAVFDSSLVYEPGVLKVYAERYLLEVPRSDPHVATARRLLELLDRFVAIYPERVPPTSLLREFVGD
jgi:uridine kinase